MSGLTKSMKSNPAIVKSILLSIYFIFNSTGRGEYGKGSRGGRWMGWGGVGVAALITSPAQSPSGFRVSQTLTHTHLCKREIPDTP